MNHLVVTTINAPTQAMLNLAKGAAERDWSFVIIGDRKSPPDFSLKGPIITIWNVRANLASSLHAWLP